MRAIALLVVSLALSGCMAGEKTAEGDGDGDYLLDQNERDGWDIEVEYGLHGCAGGAPPSRTTVHVTSNPAELDSDGDGVPDAEEFALNSDPRSHDTDQDGLTDAVERDINLGEAVKLGGGLRLNRADSDGDCLGDANETLGFDVPGIGRRTSDPTLTDTDEDGVPDGREAHTTHTDPRNPDTDNDGHNDFLDGDPHHNLGLRIVFERLHLSTGDGPLFFYYNLDGTAGPVTATNPPPFSIANGENKTVPAGHSPGTVDVQDSTELYFQLWVTRQNGVAVDLGKGSLDPIVSGRVDPASKTWVGEGRSGDASGRTYWASGEEGTLGVRLEVVFV